MVNTREPLRLWKTCECGKHARALAAVVVVGHVMVQHDNEANLDYWKKKLALGSGWVSGGHAHASVDVVCAGCECSNIPMRPSGCIIGESNSALGSRWVRLQTRKCSCGCGGRGL